MEPVDERPGIAELRAADSALRDLDLDTVDDRELGSLLTELVGLDNRLDAQISRVAQRWDASKVWQLDGSRTAATRLARDTGMAETTAKAVLRRGRKTNDHVTLGGAWAAGDLTTGHVDLLIAASGNKRGALFMRDEAELVGHCTCLLFADADTYVKAWRVRADAEVNPDGTEPVAQFVTIDETFEGTRSINGVLDPVGGEIVEASLRRIRSELDAADIAAGIAPRLQGEQNARALAEMATRAMTAPDNGRRPEPLITVVAGTHTATDLLCRTLSGHTLDPAALTPYLERAEIQSFLFALDGKTVSVSPQRTLTGLLRRAVQVRDLHCQHPSVCRVPADRCDGDHHPIPASLGGATSLDNTRMLCVAHNRFPHLNQPPEPPPQLASDPPPPPLEAWAAVPAWALARPHEPGHHPDHSEPTGAGARDETDRQRTAAADSFWQQAA